MAEIHYVAVGEGSVRTERFMVLDGEAFGLAVQALAHLPEDAFRSPRHALDDLTLDAAKKVAHAVVTGINDDHGTHYAAIDSAPQPGYPLVAELIHADLKRTRHPITALSFVVIPPRRPLET
jgi:hypothetical protein